MAQSISELATVAERISQESYFNSRYGQDIFSPSKRPDRTRSPSTPLSAMHIRGSCPWSKAAEA